MNIAYYPGCSAHGSSIDYELSTQACCKALGIHMKEIENWNCCGSTPAHATSHELSAALCGRNLDLAAKEGADLVTTPCPSCLSNLKAAAERLQDPEFRERVNSLLDQPLSEQLPPTTSVMQAIAEVISDEELAFRVKKKLTGLRFVAYYGCLMSRPHERMKFEDPENPMMMERMLTACGGEVLDFPLKTACCGAAFGIPERKLTQLNSGRILTLAHDLQVDAIVVACPLCQMNLDLRQGQVERALHKKFKLPILYYTQVIGLALGLKPKDLGFKKQIVSTDVFFARWALAQKREGA